MSDTEIESEVAGFESEPLEPKKKKRGPNGRKFTQQQREEAHQKLEKALEEENRGRGKKLTRAKRAELIKDIRHGLVQMLRPADVIAACQVRHKLSYHTIAKYLRRVQQDQLKQVGFLKVQVQELCQKALVEIVKKTNGQDSARVRAIQMLDNLFDLKVVPEDTREAQQLIVEDAMTRMDQMDISQLNSFAEQLRNEGSVNADMLIPYQKEDRRQARPRKKAVR